MTVHLTAAQARRLGITQSSATADGRRTPGTAQPAAVPGTARTTRTVAAGPYRTVCVLCHTSFTTMAAEDRHLAATSHPRYALVLGVLP